MSLYRRAAKRDASEPEIVKVLLAAGCSVVRHSGKNEPDLFVGYRRRTYAIECKTNNAPLKPGQLWWAEQWQGDSVWVLYNAAQARKALSMWAESSRIASLTNGNGPRSPANYPASSRRRPRIVNAATGELDALPSISAPKGAA